MADKLATKRTRWYDESEWFEYWTDEPMTDDDFETHIQETIADGWVRDERVSHEYVIGFSRYVEPYADLQYLQISWNPYA